MQNSRLYLWVVKLGMGVPLIWDGCWAVHTKLQDPSCVVVDVRFLSDNNGKYYPFEKCMIFLDENSKIQGHFSVESFQLP